MVRVGGSQEWVRTGQGCGQANEEGKTPSHSRSKIRRRHPQTDPRSACLKALVLTINRSCSGLAGGGGVCVQKTQAGPAGGQLGPSGPGRGAVGVELLLWEWAPVV